MFRAPGKPGSSTSALRNLRVLARRRPVAERNNERAEVAKGRRPAARRRPCDMERGRGLYALWNGREVDNDKVFDRRATVWDPAGVVLRGAPSKAGPCAPSPAVRWQFLLVNRIRIAIVSSDSFM